MLCNATTLTAEVIQHWIRWEDDHEWGKGKDLESVVHGLFCEFCPGTHLEALWKITTRNLSKSVRHWLLSRVMKLVPLKYNHVCYCCSNLLSNSVDGNVGLHMWP